MNKTYSEPEEVHLNLPTAAILCLAISAYLILILLGLLIRKCLITHGICTDCCPKYKDSTECCFSCNKCAQQCNWKLPTVNCCLDLICPTKQKVNCLEFLVCDWSDSQCCNESGTYTCGSGSYSCTCETPRCESINCLCCEISFRSVTTAT